MKKVNKSNGKGGQLTDVEWDIYYGRASRLEEISKYPVWSPSSIDFSAASRWALVKTNYLNGSKDFLFYTNSNNVGTEKEDWWVANGKPEYFWINVFYSSQLSYRNTEFALAISDSNCEHRKYLDKIQKKREEARVKKYGLNIEEDRRLKKLQVLEKQFFKFECRRPDYLLKIQRENELLIQMTKFLTLSDEEFSAAYSSLTKETIASWRKVMNGDAYRWILRRHLILKVLTPEAKDELKKLSAKVATVCKQAKTAKISNE